MTFNPSSDMVKGPRSSQKIAKYWVGFIIRAPRASSIIHSTIPPPMDVFPFDLFTRLGGNLVSDLLNIISHIDRCPLWKAQPENFCTNPFYSQQIVELWCKKTCGKCSNVPTTAPVTSEKK